MKDQIVSFEISKKLAELNFTEPCFYHYSDLRQIEPFLTWVVFGDPVGNDWHEVGFYAAPTQSLVHKWLREIHNIDITMALVGNGYGFYIHKNRDYTNNGESYGVCSASYEEALEEGLKTALKLI